MAPLNYIAGYPAELQQQVQQLIDNNKLAPFLQQRYPYFHTVSNDKALRGYVMTIKDRYLKKSAPLSQIVYDNKIHVINNALGLHRYISRVQGGKLKSKNEIRIGSVFKQTPEPFLNMIVVHELAHIRHKEHDKNFYQLCLHMLPDYHQREFDLRLYLIQQQLSDL
ncbi:MAG: M48 family metallopeptidase [Motiliproteus sp.]